MAKKKSLPAQKSLPFDEAEELFELRKRLRKRRAVPRRAPSRRNGNRLPAPRGYSAYCQRCKYQRKEFHVWAHSPYVVIWRMEEHVLMNHALECAFCYLVFPDFPELAEHTTLAHISPEEREKRNVTKSTERKDWDPTDPEFWGPPGAVKRRRL